MVDVKRQIYIRYVIVFVAIVLFALSIIGRMVYLQICEHDKWQTRASEVSEKNITIKAKRGDICAMDGRLLSTSVPLYHIYFDTRVENITDEEFYKNLDSIAIGLSNILVKDGYTATYYKDRLRNARVQRKQVLIKRGATFLELKQIQRLPIFRKGRYKGGFVYNQEEKRVHPFLSLGQRTIGSMFETEDGSKVGYVGLEKAYEKELCGRNGICFMQKLSGNVWMPIEDGNQVEPIDGCDVITTIDVDIQDIANEALKKCLRDNEAHHGCAVVMEVATGEIRAIANLTTKISDSDTTFIEDYNYAIGESAEPGSTFKLASLIVALEDGVVDINDTVDTEGGVKMYFTSKMKDSHEGGYGVVSVRRAFEVSSNVGISKIIYNNYQKNPQRFVDRLYMMHLNDKLGIELLGEGLPDIKSPSDSLWSGISLPWMSIGYGIHITPLQTLAFYNAVANNGVMVKPKFVREIRNGGRLVEYKKTEILNPSICSSETIKKAHDLLRGVVENGTATNVRNANYTVAGKTGTAQLGYWNHGLLKHQATFVGYFPAERPLYSCIVVINSPSKGKIYGGSVAGPVFKDIADKIYVKNSLFRKENNLASTTENIEMPACRDGNKMELNEIFDMLNISYDESDAEWVSTSVADSVIKYKQRIVSNGLIPNVVGMGLRDAIYILESEGLEVDFSGVGIVRTQTPKSGQRFIKGQKVKIELR